MVKIIRNVNISIIRYRLENRQQFRSSTVDNRWRFVKENKAGH